MKNWPGKDRGLPAPTRGASPLARAAGATGKTYWRSLNDYADSPEFRAWADKEFPQLAAELDQNQWTPASPSRRRFMQIMGASIALAGVAMTPGCRRPDEKILPVNKKSPEQIPGKPLFYATTFVQAGVPMGVLVETHEGRPTKIEGNPKHPTSLGATNTFAQASILDLYDPSRSGMVLHNGQPVGMKEDFFPALEAISKTHLANKGKGLAILSEDYASPAFEMLKEHFAKVMPEAKFYVDEPSTYGLQNRLSFDLSKADVILSLDSDFLGLDDYGITNKRAFAERRKIDSNGGKMNRLYVVEPTFTVTGASADHRVRLPLLNLGSFCRALLASIDGELAEEIPGIDAKVIATIAADLKSNKGRALVLASSRNMAAQMFASILNERLGLTPTEQGVSAIPKPDDLKPFFQSIDRGDVNTLIVLGANPAFTAPADLKFAEVIRKVGTLVRLSSCEDETSSFAHWHVPQAHYLESWGDVIASDATVSPMQPMIEPLFGGITPLELLARLGNFDTLDGYEIVRRSFLTLAGKVNFEAKWRTFLHEGVFKKPSSEFGILHIHDSNVKANFKLPNLSAANLELCFALSNSTFDGRYANNGWMQEMPDPITKLSWDNAALFSPKTARELDVKHGDVVKIEIDGRSVEAPVFIAPGTADYSITLPLGYGRTKVGPVGEGAGFNAYALRTSSTLGYAVGAKVTKAGKTYKLATTQEHWSVAEHHLLDEQLHERGIVREGTLDEFHDHPTFAREMGVNAPEGADNIATNPLEQYKEAAKDPASTIHQWGMVVDMNACVGCNACSVACQAENNIPIVGKDMVLEGREMHWLRIDRYFTGEDPEGDVEAVAQPMMCQQCENAPCEPVCPVNATTHTEEGLNAMTYNRCIGTRYCANNCPYKVRRFNFFDYNKGTFYEKSKAMRTGSVAPDPIEGWSKPQSFQPDLQELSKMQKNPQVTVRMRGVMEKCTFCVQRIENARIDHNAAAGQENPGKIRDGAFQTACEQACPTTAIIFGDISQPNSRVSVAKQSPRNYEALGHLNTRPRTTYLARVRNVNPAWPKEKHARISLPILGEVRA